jgi:Zn-dependent protease
VVAGVVVALGLIAAKAKAFGLLALKFATTGWTMVLAAWAYSTQVGWSFAALLVGLILIHEIGHGLAARRVGIRVGLPVFIPFLGAFIALRERPRDRWEDFVIAAGGPLIGGLASLACLAASQALSGDARRLLHGCGYFGIYLNLFNLLPVWIFDGSKMLPLLRATDGVIGLGVAGAALIASALWADHANGMAVIVVAVVAWQVAMTARKAHRAPESLLERLQQAPAGPIAPSADEVSSHRRRIGAILYFGLIALYAAILQLSGPTLGAR